MIHKFIILTLIYFYFCFDNLNLFQRVRNINSEKTEYILALRANLVLSIISLYYLYRFISQGCDTTSYFLSISNPKDSLILQICNIFIISYFTMDCIIGKKHYHDIMNNFTGYIHHILYIILSFAILDQKLTHIYLLCMIAEIPTFIFNCGKYNKKFRHDKLFGSTFFITRIAFLLYIVFKFKNEHSIIPYVSFSAISLHIYWFYKWCKKYLMVNSDV